MNKFPRLPIYATSQVDELLQPDVLKQYISERNAFCLFEQGNFAGIITLRKIEAGNKPVDYPDWLDEKAQVPYVVVEELAGKPYYQPDEKSNYPRETKLFQAAEQRARELHCAKIFMAVPAEDETTYNAGSYDCFEKSGYSTATGAKATWTGQSDQVRCTIIEKSL